MALKDVYSVLDYGFMFGDAVRREAYTAALSRAVKPDTVVLDLGCGTGYFAMLACRLGARRVYAIDVSESVEVARALAERNGLTERIVFIQDDSRHVQLPEPVDVIVSDLRGVLPFFGAHLPTIADARHRLLKPGGMLIPERDDVRVALIEMPDAWEQFVGPWSVTDEGLDLRPGRPYVTSAVMKQQVRPEQLLSGAVTWATLDYHAVADPSAASEVELEVTRPGLACGYAFWFETELTSGVTLSTGPGSRARLYRQAVLWLPDPVRLTTGQRVNLAVRAKWIDEDYIWRWVGSFPDGVRVQQSTLDGVILSTSRLGPHAADHVPDLGAERLVDAAILRLLNGRTSQGDVASRLLADFPERFADWQEALDRVIRVALSVARRGASRPRAAVRRT